MVPLLMSLSSGYLAPVLAVQCPAKLMQDVDIAGAVVLLGVDTGGHLTYFNGEW